MTAEEENTELLLDHYRNPHNYGQIESPSAKMLDYNPVCGDAVQITLRIENGIITDIRFIGRGCSVSQGSASMLTDLVKGKSIEDAKNLSEKDILEMIGLSLGPSREKCALLPLNTLQKCIRQYSEATRSE